MPNTSSLFNVLLCFVSFTLQGIPQWCSVMDDWGSKLLGAVQAVAGMAAVGFGLPADAFTSRMTLGPHLLAPTGSDLEQHGQQGTVLAGGR
jgi:heme A synthase